MHIKVLNQGPCPLKRAIHLKVFGNCIFIRYCILHVKVLYLKALHQKSCSLEKTIYFEALHHAEVQQLDTVHFILVEVQQLDTEVLDTEVQLGSSQVQSGNDGQRQSFRLFWASPVSPSFSLEISEIICWPLPVSTSTSNI